MRTPAEKKIRWLRNDIIELRDDLEYAKTEQERDDIECDIYEKELEIERLQAGMEDHHANIRKGGA